MKTKRGSWLVALSMVCASAVFSMGVAAQSGDWKSYSYAPDGFSISAPSAPVMSKQDVPTEKGSFELRSYLVEVGSSALYVGVVDYGSAVSGRDPADVLEGAKSGAINNVKATVSKESKVTLGIYPGLSFESENDTMHFSARIYLVGSVLYQVLTASPKSEPYAGTERYLNSFQLIPRTH